MGLDQGDASLPKDVAGRKRGHDSKIWRPSQKMALPPKGWGGRAEFGGILARRLFGLFIALGESGFIEGLTVCSEACDFSELLGCLRADNRGTAVGFWRNIACASALPDHFA